MNQGSKPGPVPATEAQRLDALQEYEILNVPPEAGLDHITRIMVKVFNAPMAFISLVDKDRVFHKSMAGDFGLEVVDRDDSFCSIAILENGPLVVEDATQDERMKNSPFVQQPQGIRFYAGAPLVTPGGHKIGTACIADLKPRKFTDAEIKLLTEFASLAMYEIELLKARKSQERSEALLAGNNKELHFVTDNMPQLVWATDPDGHAFYFNKGWLQYTGLPLEEVTGNGWTQSLHADDYDLTFEVWSRSVATGEPYEIEYRLKRHDGAYRWFIARGIPMRDEAGNIVKWYGTTTDIHDHKTALEQLRQSKERFELVSKATQDAIWDWNLITNSVWWNEGFKELFGYKDEEIEPDASSWYNRIHPDDRDRVVGSIHNIIDHGGSQWNDEYRFRRKNGSYATVYDRGYAVHNKDGKPVRMLGSMQDITESKTQQEKIKESETRFQAAVTAVEGIVWTNDAEGKMAGEQPGWSQLTGQSYEEYKGYGWADAVHPDDAQPTIDAWNQAVKEKSMFVFEHRVKTKEGDWRLFSIRAVPVCDEAGNTREWVGVHTDITEQRNAEELVRQSEQRFQNLVRQSTAGIVVLMGKEMKVALVNDAFGRLIGRTADSLMHHPVFDIVPETEARFRPILDNVLMTGDPLYLYDTPYQVFAETETIEGYLNLVYQPYRETDGRITGVMVLCQDVTEQVLARNKVAEAEETARLAIAAAELGTYHINLQTNEMVGSPRLSEIFDVELNSTREQYLAKIHPDDVAIRKKGYEEAYKTGQLEYEGRVIRRNGSINWYRVKGSMLFDEEKQPLKIVGVVQDITEEKQFAQELARQVKERTHEIEQFAYVSHHDLQEPLRKISIFCDMIQGDADNQLSEFSQSRLQKVIDASRRMSIALKDVLNFASLNKEESKTDVNLHEILAAIQTDLELAIADKQASIHTCSLPVIKAVPQQIHQLFYNLLNNALKFSKPGQPPVINIDCRQLDKNDLKEHAELLPSKTYYEFMVQDNGIGFDPESAEQIFLLFQRLHSKETYSGSGIGLALCKKVVANHGGKIWASANEGAGSTFTIILPAD